MTFRTVLGVAALLAARPLALADAPPAALAPAPPAPPAQGTEPDPPRAEVKKVAEPPLFPLWGEKARAAGFELPPAWGLMVNYYYQRSSIEIANLKLGVNGGPMYDASFIQFADSVASAHSVGLRPNLMIFPFLTVYGVINAGSSSTTVNIIEPATFTSVADSKAFVGVIGATAQMGYKGFFGVADFNYGLADVDRLADLMGSNLLSFRLGYNHKLAKPGRSIAVWAGTAGQVLDVEPKGTVKLSEVIPQPTPEQAAAFTQRCAQLGIDNRPNEACDQIAAALTAWANGTPPTTTVEYSLDKKPKDVWNMIAGAQYALDRNWMFRVEAGFLSSRTSVLVATEYRWDSF
jgi:hypothetical protein